MYKVILSMILLLLAVVDSHSYTCADLDGAYLYSQESTPVYLGFFGNAYASESVMNLYGSYGSPYNLKSVRNTVGTYGSSYSQYSANNSIALYPPQIYKYGILLGHLTTNTMKYNDISLTAIDEICSFSSSSPKTESIAVPSRPTNVQASDGLYSDVIALSWNPVYEATSYNVYYGTSATDTPIPIDNTWQTSMDIIGATPGTNYYFWVSAVNSAGEGDLSEPDTGFTTNQITVYQLSITKSGSGTITSNPSGINCGSECSYPYEEGTTVALTAIEGQGYTFSGWSGACSGTEICELEMDSSKDVTATFIPDIIDYYTLTVSLSGTGSGVLSSTPLGISCGDECEESYPYETVVTLTPAPSAGSVFTGWSGSCAGSDMCQVTMDTNRSVTASFDRAESPPLNPVNLTPIFSLLLKDEVSRFDTATFSSNDTFAE